MDPTLTTLPALVTTVITQSVLHVQTFYLLPQLLVLQLGYVNVMHVLLFLYYLPLLDIKLAHSVI